MSTAAALLPGPLYRPKQDSTLAPATLRRPVRTLWATIERWLGATGACDRCGRAMSDCLARGNERICIACVESDVSTAPIGSAELAGCTAVLSELLREVPRIANAGSPEHLTALLATASTLVWWMSPPSIRELGALRIDRGSVIHLLSSYEVKWGRATGIRPFAATFQIFMQIQLRAMQYAELAAIDRRYCALTGKESVVRDVARAR